MRRTFDTGAAMRVRDRPVHRHVLAARGAAQGVAPDATKSFDSDSIDPAGFDHHGHDVPLGQAGGFDPESPA